MCVCESACARERERERERERKEREREERELRCLSCIEGKKNQIKTIRKGTKSMKMKQTDKIQFGPILKCRGESSEYEILKVADR